MISPIIFGDTVDVYRLNTTNVEGPVKRHKIKATFTPVDGLTRTYCGGGKLRADRIGEDNIARAACSSRPEGSP